MEKEKWFGDTRRVVTVGTSLGVVLTREMLAAAELKKGDIIEINVRNTGKSIGIKDLSEKSE